MENERKMAHLKQQSEEMIKDTYSKIEETNKNLMANTKKEIDEFWKETENECYEYENEKMVDIEKRESSFLSLSNKRIAKVVVYLKDKLK